MLLEIEGISLPIAHLFRPQGYRKLTDTLTATFAGFVVRDRRERESDVGELYRLEGEGRDDEKYYVETIPSKAVVQAFIGGAQQVSKQLPDRGQMGTYELAELGLPKGRKKNEPLDPTSPLFRALVVGVQKAHPSRTLDVK